MNSLKLITGPTSYPVSLAEAKEHLRVTEDDEDLLIEALITAACQYVEEYMGRALHSQTFDLYLDQFPTEQSVLPKQITLPRSPLIEVVDVFYSDTNSSEQTFADTDYTVDAASEHPRVVLLESTSWPSTRGGANAVRIRFRSGYVDTNNSPATGEVPEVIRSAILLMIGHLYANREGVIVGQTVAELPLGIKALLDMKRVDISLA